MCLCTSECRALEVNPECEGSEYVECVGILCECVCVCVCAFVPELLKGRLLLECCLCPYVETDIGIIPLYRKHLP